MEEIWKTIPGYENLYEASDLGRIRRVSGLIGGRWGTQFVEGRILKPRKCRGYLAVHLSKNDVQKSTKIHKLVMLAFTGDCSGALQTNHKNGNKHDNRFVNLERMTGVENIQHRIHVLGISKITNAKLTPHDVREIRKMHAEGISGCAIARQFGVSSLPIYRIIHGRGWTHVHEPVR